MPDLPDEANAIECYDCDTIYRGETECPANPEEHGYSEVYVTTEPLGLLAKSKTGDVKNVDADNWHYGMEVYVYDMGAIESAKAGL